MTRCLPSQERAAAPSRIGLSCTPDRLVLHHLQAVALCRAIMRGLAAVAAVLLAHGAAATDADAARPWMDAELPIEERVSHLLAQMNREEKIAMTFATHTGSDVVKGFNKTGVGAAKFMSAFSCPLDNTKSCVQQRNELQQMFKSSSRLGIPISFRGELLHSGALPDSVVFPMPCSLGATWNRTLARAVASESAADARDGGIDYGFGPVLQVRREDEGRVAGRRNHVMTTLSSLSWVCVVACVSVRVFVVGVL